MFQSPSRGGHLRGSMPIPRMADGLSFSPLHEGDTSVAVAGVVRDTRFLSFSPLHEGDTSVAPRKAPLLWSDLRFSPLHEGDTSVARTLSLRQRPNHEFQSPSRGGHLRGAT